MSGVAAMSVVAIGALVLLGGWLFALPAFKSVFPGGVSMKVNAALCLMLAGTSLLSAWRRRMSAGGGASWRMLARS